MSFKEFDMSEYIEALEQFKVRNEEQVVKHWGSVEKFNEFVQKIKDDETNVAKMAIKQFGSIEKYTEAMKYNLEHFSELMEQGDEIKDQMEDITKKSDALYSKLTADMSKDVTCSEVQKVVGEIVELMKSTTIGMDMGEGYWDMFIEGYSQENLKQITDQKYGSGAAEYIAKAFRHYFDHVSNL